MRRLASSFFSLSMSASLWLVMYSVSMRASCLRSSSSAASRPLYSASSKQASSTVFDSLSAASLSRFAPKWVVKVTEYDIYLHIFTSRMGYCHKVSLNLLTVRSGLLVTLKLNNCSLLTLKTVCRVLFIVFHCSSYLTSLHF